MKQDNKSEQVGFRITFDAKKKLEALAKAEHRTLSNYVEIIIMKHIEGMR